MTFTTKVKTLFTKKETQNLLSIALRQDAVSYCFSAYKKSPKLNIIPVLDDNHNSALTNLHNIDDLSANCVLVLSAKHYQIVQVDKPNIPDNELIAALKWQIKDLVTFPADDMVLDYFDGPTLANTEKLNVVCGQKSKLKDMVSCIHKSDLTLDKITTEEFAFAQLVNGKEGGQLLVCQQPNEEILILIVRDNRLFSYRRLRGMANIAQRTPDELAMGLIDNLSIEIQKSIDFFERQLKQPPVKTINVLLPIEHEAFIARKLSENTNVPVELINLPEQYHNERAFAVVIGSMMSKDKTPVANVIEEPIMEPQV
jgi:MSHA biogenesis protein MshI